MKQYKLADLFKTSWTELSEQEMIAVINISEKLYQHPDQSSTQYGHLVIDMLKVLRKHSAVSKIEEEQAVDCFNHIHFFRRNDRGEFLQPWTHFPVKGFVFNQKHFEAPEPGRTLPMYERTFDQLVYADSAFSAFCVLNYQHQQTPTKELEVDMDAAVNGLIGVLYSLPENFRAVDMEKNARIVSLHFNTEQRALILHTYANIRRIILDRYPDLFPRNDDKDEDDSNPPAPQHTGPMWMNLRYELAETEAFRGLETVRNALMYDVLDYLNKKALDNLKLKKQHG